MLDSPNRRSSEVSVSTHTSLMFVSDVVWGIPNVLPRRIVKLTSPELSNKRSCQLISEAAWPLVPSRTQFPKQKRWERRAHGI